MQQLSFQFSSQGDRHVILPGKGRTGIAIGLVLAMVLHRLAHHHPEIWTAIDSPSLVERVLGRGKERTPT